MFGYAEKYARLPLHEVPFCAIDVETTPVPNVPRSLALTEVGALRFRGDAEADAAFVSLVNPGCPIRAFDTQVSGISDRTVADAPQFRDIYPRFAEYIAGAVIIAHNASFDKRAIESQCERDGLDSPPNVYVDSVALLKRAVELRSYKLAEVCRHFGVRPSQVHRAGGDCEAVRELFLCAVPLLREKCGISQFGQLCKLLGIDIYPRPTQGTLFGLS